MSFEDVCCVGLLEKITQDKGQLVCHLKKHAEMQDTCREMFSNAPHRQFVTNKALKLTAQPTATVPDRVAHTFNPSNWDTGAGGSL